MKQLIGGIGVVLVVWGGEGDPSLSVNLRVWHPPSEKYTAVFSNNAVHAVECV